MRKLILMFVVAFLSQFTFGQSTFKDDVLKVLKASGAAAQMEMAKEQIMGSIPEAKKADFSKEFDASLPDLYDKMAKIYMESYSHDEIKEMLKFYDSPVGKKITNNTSELMKKNMQASQEWAVGLQGMMMKYMQ